MENLQQHIARMQLVYGDDDEQLDAVLSESLAPRPPDFLFDLAVPLLTPDSRLLDVGCRDARHLIPLVARSGCTGVGIDPIDRNVDRARAAVTAADLDQEIEIRRGLMEQIEEPDSSVDVVWCRDVLEVVPDLQAGLSEVARVLKPGGAAVIYTVFATPRLEPREAAAFQPLGNVPQTSNVRGSKRASHMRVSVSNAWKRSARSSVIRRGTNAARIRESAATRAPPPAS